jgi:hypothetical protein
MYVSVHTLRAMLRLHAVSADLQFPRKGSEWLRENLQK